MTVLYEVIIIVEIFIFSAGIMLYLMRLSKRISSMERTNGLNQFKQQAYGLQQPPPQPQPRSQMIEPTGYPVKYPDAPQVKDLPFTSDPCQKCGLSLADHTIQQAEFCGYNDLKKVKISDIKEPNKFIKEEKKK